MKIASAMARDCIKLVCVRHGESAWNKDNKFCGWIDVPLSETGEKEAVRAANAIKSEPDLIFDKVYTSLLKRANRTADVIVKRCCSGDRQNKQPQIIKDWRLNERHYGGLTGLNKAEMAEKHGKEQVQIWRRSFDVPPPPMTPDHPYYSEINDNPLFNDVPKGCIPDRESLKDLIERVEPYWRDEIKPSIQNCERVLIVAHGTSLRGLVKIIEDLTDEQVTKLNLPTGIPFVYELDKQSLEILRPKKFLADEETVRKAIDKVASIGSKTGS